MDVMHGCRRLRVAGERHDVQQVEAGACQVSQAQVAQRMWVKFGHMCPPGDLLHHLEPSPHGNRLMSIAPGLGAPGTTALTTQRWTVEPIVGEHIAYL